VRAKAVEQTQDGRWSSVAAHLSGKDVKLVKVAPILERYGDFAALLGQGTEDETEFKSLRQSETTGRPLGSEEWMEKRLCCAPKNAGGLERSTVSLNRTIPNEHRSNSK
jgi:putative transposase